MENHVFISLYYLSTCFVSLAWEMALWYEAHLTYTGKCLSSATTGEKWNGGKSPYIGSRTKAHIPVSKPEMHDN
jgi:hypothetical protein